MLKLIADSGSTKTDWALVDGNSVVARPRTEGINPFHASEEFIDEVLLHKLLPQLGDADVREIHFYGSGCTPQMAPVMERHLSVVFPGASVVEAQGDLLAAARATCGKNAGIACILGTGANSCLYDGQQITANTPPLGYILGDEGSGAVLGKLFLNGIFKGFLPSWMRDDYLESNGLTYPDVIRKVYREPLANKYLASIANFMYKYIEHEEIQQLVCGNFHQFFQRNLVQYHQKGRVGFVGGIAYQYAEQLNQVAREEGYELSMIEKSPIQGLIKYHQ